MIELTIIVLLSGKVLGVLPSVEHFASQDQCRERGKELAKMVRRPKGATIQAVCEFTSETKA